MDIARGEFSGARGVGGISGAGGKNINPVYKEINFDSPESRTRFAVSQNKKALEASNRKAKNDAIQKEAIRILKELNSNK
jgi:hypothetical protein